MLSLGLGCDASPPTERAEIEAAPELGLAAASECDDTCDATHCDLVLGWRAEAEAAGDTCAVACRDAEIECMIDPEIPCGWCGIESNECVDACTSGYCDAALAASVLAEVAAREQAVCESDCYVTQLECMAADHEYEGECGQCELDAAVCRGAC